MKLLLCLVLLVSCASEIQEPAPVPTPKDPFPYDDFVYGDSFVDEDKDGESTELDCNDENPSIWTGAVEACNGIDDNCNGQADEEGACL